jgi:uncharacterized protein
MVAWSLGRATTMLANAAGPVMTIYLLAARLAKYEFIGTSAWFYCLINLIKLPFSYSLGLINLNSLGFNLILLPGVALGALAGQWLLKIVPQLWFERLLLASAALAALRLIWHKSSSRAAHHAVLHPGFALRDTIRLRIKAI